MKRRHLWELTCVSIYLFLWFLTSLIGVPQALKTVPGPAYDIDAYSPVPFYITISYDNSDGNLSGGRMKEHYVWILGRLRHTSSDVLRAY
jgi:hypothetical protein